jgi:hypothetical protein
MEQWAHQLEGVVVYTALGCGESFEMEREWRAAIRTVTSVPER